MSLRLEDLSAGQQFVSAGRTVTEADVVAFAGLSGDFNPLHVDETWVTEHTSYRGRIAHGLLVLAISSGLRTPELEELEVLAYLEVLRSFVAPVYPGDTIRAHWSVDAMRRSRSRPGAGVARLSVEVRKHDGEVVQRGSDVYLVGAADPAAAILGEGA